MVRSVSKAFTLYNIYIYIHTYTITVYTYVYILLYTRLTKAGVNAIMV